MGNQADLAVVVLAAGQGTRMRSRTPKVLHPLCGRPLLLHTLELTRELGAKRRIVVLGKDSQEVQAALRDEPVEIVHQNEPLGTGHAVLQTRALLENHEGPILVLYGDHALYRAQTLEKMVDHWQQTRADLALLTGELPDPSGYGRIVRTDDGRIEAIVEQSEASKAILALREVNLGVYLARPGFIFAALSRVTASNQQAEFFLTDLVEIGLRDGRRIETVLASDWTEALGVNDRVDLARAEAVLRRRINEHWMRAGVTFVDPDQTLVEIDVQIGPDTRIEPGCQLHRGSRIGRGCRLEAHAVIDASTLADRVWIKPGCWLEQSEVGADCVIGPSAHLRPQSRLARDVRIGNFVEVKNSNIGEGTKADHLSYIGDADIGSRVTFACGAITVNYDGRKKNRTVVGDDSFVGCNANLIAPVTLAAKSFVAAGSTITLNVPGDALALGRAHQRNIAGWRRRYFGPEDD